MVHGFHVTMIWYDIFVNSNWVATHTFTHKQYIEQNNRHKQYIEQHNSLIRKSADRAPSLKNAMNTLEFAL
jgi:hypothetical protein